MNHAMYLDDKAPVAGHREPWMFSKKLAASSLTIDKDTLLGVLSYKSVSRRGGHVRLPARYARCRLGAAGAHSGRTSS